MVRPCSWGGVGVLIGSGGSLGLYMKGGERAGMSKGAWSLELIGFCEVVLYRIVSP